MDTFDTFSKKSEGLTEIKKKTESNLEKICFYEKLEAAYMKYLSTGVDTDETVDDFKIFKNEEQDLQIQYVGTQNEFKKFNKDVLTIFDVYNDLKNTIIPENDKNIEILKEITRYKPTELDEQILTQIL